MAGEVVGVEVMELPGTNQDHPVIDRMILGNVETMTLDLPTNHFDVVLCGDVLEHLVDPWAVVDQVATYLKPGGVWITSLPNIKSYWVLYQLLLKSDFAYAEQGILDKTHLRLFCKKNSVHLFTADKLRVVHLLSDMHQSQKFGPRHWADMLTGGASMQVLMA
ncbi:MAG: methyltransferase domain-containing protein [Catalinimonas sp.]